MIPKVHVRPARPDDYEGVMAIIPDLWGAVDYMPVMYHTYFSNPCAHPYVGVVEGKVVSILRAYYFGNEVNIMMCMGLPLFW